jgi:hypothetical protein
MFAKLRAAIAPTYADEIEKKAYSSAALDKLGLGFFLNGVFGEISAEETARCRKRISKKREWVDSLTDPKWREAYSGWLDHAEYCCKKADRYREERPDVEKRMRAYDEERRAVASVARSLPDPR